MPDTNNNKPNNLTPAPKTSDKLIAAGTLALNTGIVAGAPVLNNLNPSINPQNAGGIPVTLIGNGILVIVQAFAAQDWFDDYKYAIWVGIALAAVVCGGLYIFFLGNIELGVLNTFGAMHQFATNYGPLNKLGVFSRPGDIPQEPTPAPPVQAPINIEQADKVEVIPSGPTTSASTTTDNSSNPTS